MGQKKGGRRANAGEIKSGNIETNPGTGKFRVTRKTLKKDRTPSGTGRTKGDLAKKGGAGPHSWGSWRDDVAEVMEEGIENVHGGGAEAD